MMYPNPITLPRSAVKLTSRHGTLDPTKELYVDSRLFTTECGESPSAAWSGSDDRYRVRLTIEDWPELDGVYYVGGWQDDGSVHLEDDEAPRRREAILAQRARRTA